MQKLFQKHQIASLDPNFKQFTKSTDVYPVLSPPPPPMQKQTLDKLSIEKYLNLDCFLDNLEPADYIDQVSKDISNYTRRQSQASTSGRYINPTPYIKVFSQLQSKLNDLDDECKRRKEKFEQDVAKTEQLHYQNVIKQTSDASNIQSKFNELASTVEKLSVSKTEPLGEKLHKVQKAKDNSESIIKITKAYNNFYTSGLPTTDLMKRNEMSATILNQLLILSSKLSTEAKLPNSKTTHDIIKKFGDDFENDLLESFRNKYRAKMYDQLYTTTKSLFSYNNGVNIVDFFVKNHPFLNQFEKNDSMVIDINWLNQLSDPYFSNYKIDSSTMELFNEIKDLLISQIEPITKAFQENSNKVIILFFKQAFDKVLSKRIDPVLSKAYEMNKLSYLRALQIYSSEIYDKIIIELKLNLENENKDLNDEIESLFLSLFSNYFKNESYFRLEKLNLEDLMNKIINPFINQNSEVIKRQLLSDKIEIYKEQQENELNDDEETEINVNASTSDDHSSLHSNTITTNSKLTITSRAMARFEFYLPDSRGVKEKFKSARQRVPRSKKFRRFVSKVPFMKGNDKSNDNFSIMGFNHPHSSGSVETDNLLSLEITEKLFKFVIESLDRATGLVPNQMAQYTIELFELLLNKTGPSYISVGLASIYQNSIYPFLPGFRSKSINDLDVNFLSQFKVISLQLYIMSTIIKKSFYPLLNNNTLLNKISLLFNGYIQDVEIGVNIIIDEIIKLTENQIDSILKSQALNDYIIPLDDCTDTCEQLCKFLENLLQSIQFSLKFSSPLKMNVISKISNYLLNSLIYQFTKFQFNDYGITTLTNDGIQYLSLFNILKANNLEYSNELNNSIPDKDDENYQIRKDELDYELNKIEDIQKAYQILNDLPGLFNSTSLQQLRDFANEGRLKYLKKDVLDKFVQKRIASAKR